MAPFVHSNEFKALNVGFSLDEGVASPTDTYPVFYAERSVWCKKFFFFHLGFCNYVYMLIRTLGFLLFLVIRFDCSGTTGHGSLLHKNTAGEKVGYILNKFLEFRSKEVQKLEQNEELTIGDVTTVNLTIIEGGVQTNVVPPEMKISFDVRLAIDVSHVEFEKMVCAPTQFFQTVNFIQKQ